MDPITPSPTAKMARRDTGGFKEITPPLSSMRWVHLQMKGDLEKAFKVWDKYFNNSCNFWLRYIMWKKKDLTKIDKDNFTFESPTEHYSWLGFRSKYRRVGYGKGASYSVPGDYYRWRYCFRQDQWSGWILMWGAVQ